MSVVGFTGNSGQISEESQQSISEMCPSNAQSFENAHKDVVSSIYRTLDFLDRRMQRVMDTKLEKIKEYYHRLPVNLKTGYYDVMILYSPTDFKAAEKYREHLKSLEMESGREVRAVLCDDSELESLAASKFQHLDEAFKRCTFAFVFLTKQFCENEWCQLSSEECLMESIYNPKRKWCVVPVYTIQRSKADFRVPMGLNSLKGVNYYNNDEFYRRGLKKLIGDKLYIREKNEQVLLEDQYNYAVSLEEDDHEKLKQDERRLKQQRSHNPEYMPHQQYGFQNQKSWPQPSVPFNTNTQDTYEEEFQPQPNYAESTGFPQDLLSNNMTNLAVSGNETGGTKPFQSFTVSQHPPTIHQIHSQESPVLLSDQHRREIHQRRQMPHPQNTHNLNQPVHEGIQPASLSTQQSPSLLQGNDSSAVSHQNKSSVEAPNSGQSQNISAMSGPHSLSGSQSLAEDQYPSDFPERPDGPERKTIHTATPAPNKKSNGQKEVVNIIEHHVHHHYHDKPSESKVVNIVNAANVVVGRNGHIITTGTQQTGSKSDDDGDEETVIDNTESKTLQ